LRTLGPGTTPLGRPTFGGQLGLLLVGEQVHRRQECDRESRGKLRRVARDRWRNQKTKTRAARISRIRTIAEARGMSGHIWSGTESHSHTLSRADRLAMKKIPWNLLHFFQPDPF